MKAASRIYNVLEKNLHTFINLAETLTISMSLSSDLNSSLRIFQACPPKSEVKN